MILKLQFSYNSYILGISRHFNRSNLMFSLCGTVGVSPDYEIFLQGSVESPTFNIFNV